MSEIQPIFVSLKQAGQMLGISTWSARKLCEDGLVESRYHGTRRLVSVASLAAFAETLPTKRPDEASA